MDRMHRAYVSDMSPKMRNMHPNICHTESQMGAARTTNVIQRIELKELQMHNNNTDV